MRGLGEADLRLLFRSCLRSDLPEHSSRAGGALWRDQESLAKVGEVLRSIEIVSESLDLLESEADTRCAGASRVAYETFRSKRGLEAVGRRKDQGVGARMSMIGNDQCGARRSPQMTVEFGRVEQRTVSRQYRNPLEISCDRIPDPPHR